jgi:hypothetical protein
MLPEPLTVDSFPFLYVDDVRSLQETDLRATTACYGDDFYRSLIISVVDTGA